MMGEVTGYVMIILLFVALFVFAAMHDIRSAIWGFVVAGSISAWVMGGCYLITGGV